MLNTLGFYNHYGAGDIFESREFVREIMTIFPAQKYVYYMGKSPRLMLDFPNLEVSNDVPVWLSAMKPFKIVNNNLFINTWIGRDSRYVLPGIGCTVEKLYEMYDEILNNVEVGTRLRQPMLNYLTDFNFHFYKTNLIDIVMQGNTKHRKCVYISNGNVQSNQAENFNMTPLIILLAQKFTPTLFFITQADSEFYPYPNIKDANEFAPGFDSNLPELSYLSQFCDVLIGRNSGTHVYAWTRHNCMRDMLNITLTKNRHCSHFVHHTPIPMRTVWSNQTDTDALFKLISGELEKEFKDE